MSAAPGADIDYATRLLSSFDTVNEDGAIDQAEFVPLHDFLVKGLKQAGGVVEVPGSHRSPLKQAAHKPDVCSF